MRQLFTARLARQKDYRLTKTLIGLDGNVLGIPFTGRWEYRRGISTGLHGADIRSTGYRMWAFGCGCDTL